MWFPPYDWSAGSRSGGADMSEQAAVDAYLTVTFLLADTDAAYVVEPA